MTNIYTSRKEEVREEVLSKSNVVGLGIGFKNNDPTKKSIVVMVETKKPLSALSKEDVIPKTYGAVKTDVIETGEIRAGLLPALDISRKSKWRPAPGGVSIGHYRVTAGTLGTVVYSKKTGNRLLLSNNHVFANSNDAEFGDSILQPGAADGGEIANDILALLASFMPIDFGEEPGYCPWAEYYTRFWNWVAEKYGSEHRVRSFKIRPQATNYFDAAIAQPINQVDIDPHILDIGEVVGVEPAFLGMKVIKSGRTTEFTQGTISLVDATVRVSYGGSRVATFDNQLVAGAMSQGGDSGSLVVWADLPRAVGLLFAGSAQTTIFSPIQPILDYFEVEFKDDD